MWWKKELPFEEEGKIRELSCVCIASSLFRQDVLKLFKQARQARQGKQERENGSRQQTTITNKRSSSRWKHIALFGKSRSSSFV